MKLSSLSIAPALWLGAVVGLALAAAPSCGKPKPTPSLCNADTCAGCCDTDTQECYTGKVPAACGALGASCIECGAGQSCVSGQCRNGSVGGGSAGGGSVGGGSGGGGGSGVCSPTTCTGCCSSNGQCITAQSFNACGKGGMACAPCGAMTSCLAGECKATTCNQCRDFAGNCRGGPVDNDYCGTDGGICLRCNTGNGETCTAGRCTGTITQCGANNCDGCCAGSNCVHPDSGISANFQCGLNGSMCQTCSGSGAMCNNGVCSGGTGGAGGAGGFGGSTGLPDLCGIVGMPCQTSECCDVDAVVQFFPTCYAAAATCGGGGVCNGTSKACE